MSILKLTVEAKHDGPLLRNNLDPAGAVTRAAQSSASGERSIFSFSCPRSFAWPLLFSLA